MTPLLLLRALVAVAASLPAIAAAQSFSDPGLGLGVRGGVSDGASAANATFTGAVLLRYRFSASIGLEGAVGYRTETVDDGAGALLDLREVPVTGTGQLFFFPRTRVQPFLLAGAGLHVVRAAPKGRNTDVGGGTEAQFGFHFGAGVDVRPSRSSALTLEARWVYVEPTAVTGLSDAGYDVKPGYLSVTLGVTFFR